MPYPTAAFPLKRKSCQNVILNFTPTVQPEDSGSGFCGFRVDPGDVWIYPSRLRLDFSLLSRPVTRIEADTFNNCGCTVLFAYSGASRIALVGNTATYQTLALDFTNSHPDRCELRSFEGRIDEIRIFTGEEPPPVLHIQKTNASVVISWPTSQSTNVLESTPSLAKTAVWGPVTNNIQLEESNYVYRVIAPVGGTFFRLRRLN